MSAVALIGRVVREWPATLYWEGRRALRSLRRRFLPVKRCRVGGIRVTLLVSSASEHYRADTYATKEPETIEWLRARLRDDDVFFDVGANVGLYSIFAAKLRPGCRIYAFEPESLSFSSLCRNIRLNRIENITPCGIPLSDQETFELFRVYGFEPGSALHSLGGPSPFQERPETLKQGTISVTLDGLVSTHGLPPPALLKVDVDGIEERILAGGDALLRSGRLRSILVEVTHRDDGGPTWAEHKLAAYGYSLTGRSEWTTEIGALRSQNFIFDR